MKKNYLLKISIILIIIFFPLLIKANVAMPGFFNTGGGGNFEPLNKEEYTLAKNIQMKNELITIQLFKGFAIVKGEYDMMNYSDKNIIIDTSFPKNSSFKNQINVFFKKLEKLEVKVNNNLQKIQEKENWYQWKTNFKPKSITKILIYYIVDTSQAILREGYDKSKDCGFSYILETGKPWKDKIESGKIFIKLMDNITIDDIYGVLPNDFLYNENNLIYSFNNLDPEPENNIVIRYKNDLNDFNFESYLINYKKYFLDIDNLLINDKDINMFKKLNKTNFSPPNYSEWFFLSIILIICIIIFLPIILILVFIIKKLRKKN